MLSWISSLWTTGLFSGPARNAPNNGVGIKSLIDQKPAQVVGISDAELKVAIDNLKKTEPNTPYVSDQPPVLIELNKVFGMGNENFFEAIKAKRNAKLKAKLDQLILQEQTI